MRLLPPLFGLFLVFAVPTVGQSGLYYSQEDYAQLPSHWRGFMIDHKILRSIAIKPSAGNPASPMRERYLAAVDRLEKAAKKSKLTADEQADLGALYVRLGEPATAVQRLRAAQREYPNHFAIAANLGTAWQIAGDLGQARGALQESVRLAPAKWKRAEEMHLQLVQLRLRKKGLADLEDLLGIRWLDQDGQYAPGKVSPATRKSVADDAPALVQQLALWLPGDGPVLWQLAELANYYGDFGSAAAMMDGCVTQYGMSDRQMQLRRQMTRAAADAQRKQLEKIAKAEHGQEQIGTLKAQSKRPLIAHFDQSSLPPISAKSANGLPWGLIAETTRDKQMKPTFPKYLKDLEGKLVTISGFMQPIGEDLDISAMMLVEYPVGCWYCEMPDLTQIIYVELPGEKTTPATRQVIRVTGRLSLNTNDPEDFLFAIRDAKVHEVD
jgi:tetratricopeptide (TPR) repeat protein